MSGVCGERLAGHCRGLAAGAEALAEEALQLHASGAWRGDEVIAELAELAYHWASLCQALGVEPRHLLEMGLIGILRHAPRGRADAASRGEV
jgi:hypothetical protein